MITVYNHYKGNVMKLRMNSVNNYIHFFFVHKIMKYT